MTPPVLPADEFKVQSLKFKIDHDQYEVVEPPIGAAITTLPDNAQSIVINGIQYYELNGVYYQPITKDDGKVFDCGSKIGFLTANAAFALDWLAPRPRGSCATDESSGFLALGLVILKVVAG